MEAIAALGLASNILQCLQFSTDFATKSLEIYRSGDDAFRELAAVDTVAKDLEGVLHKLQTAETASSDFDVGNSKLAKQCSATIIDLLATLRKIGLYDVRRKRDAIVIAFRTIWDGTKISQLQARISEFREQLMLNLLQSLRVHATRSLDQQDAIMRKLDAMDPESSRKRSRNPNKQHHFEDDVPGRAYLEHVTSEIKPTSRHEEMNRLGNGLKRLLSEWPSGNGSRSQDFNLSERRQQDLQARFLACLYYSGMDDRRSRIAKAHEVTFRWIFDDNDSHPGNWANFRDWLESDSQLYWITGKAGSGKSTLMKFIIHHEDSTTDEPNHSSRHRKHLSVWAGEHRLVVASFYFWASGGSMEASHRGLYLSLLYQILGQCPELIPAASPNQWETLCLLNLTPEHFTAEELQVMMRNTVQSAVVDYKFCLFIDGLDEFDGRSEDLLGVLYTIVSFPNVKLCVASRPWVVFEDAFAQKPSLMLQDLTFPDIRNFVSSTFDADEGFKRLHVRESAFAESLIDNVASKASGVFLWVHLVVKSLLTGMAYDDRVSDLQRRLDLLPPDLERLYDVMLYTLDPFYAEHTAQYFQLMHACEEPPSALLFSFADEDEEFALQLSIEEISASAKSSRIETARRRINSRCKGLLEVVTGTSTQALGVQISVVAAEDEGEGASEPVVQYLHKTVKEYIQSPTAASKFQRSAGHFDRHLRLCSANLAVLKTMLPTSTWEISNHVNSCIKHAASASQDKILFSLLDEVVRVLNVFLQGSELEQSASTTRTDLHYQLYWARSLEPWMTPGFEPNFISLAVRAGIVGYINARVSRGAVLAEQDHPQIRSESAANNLSRLKKKLADKFSSKLSPSRGSTKGWPLLLDAMVAHPPRLETFAALLNAGADPNLRIASSGTTVWMEILAMLLSDCVYLFDDVERIKERWELWRPILQMCIKHGALMSDEVIRTSSNPRRFNMSLSVLNQECVSRSFKCLHRGDTDSAFKHLQEALELSD